MTGFQEFGLGEPLLRSVEDEGIEVPTALQQGTIAVLRRGGNIFARAGSGSGKTLAFGLGVLDRLEPRTDEDEGAALRLLVLRPTAEEAERTALALVPLAQAAGMVVAVPGGGWATAPAEAEVLVATPGDALAAVRGSELKLESLQALVVDGASDILELGGADALEALLDHTPREAQRVVFSAVASEGVEDLVERRVKRALRHPAEPAVPTGPATPRGTLGYATVAEADKAEAVVRLLPAEGEAGMPPVLFCRTDDRAAELAEALSTRGVVVGETDDPDADAAVVAAGSTRAEVREESGEEPGRTISFDVPADEAVLLARHEGDDQALVLASPRELAHLREIARRAGLRLAAVAIPGEPSPAAAEVQRFRRTLRTAVAEQDLGAQLLLLEPLLREFGAAEVAAAAVALLRSKLPAAPQESAAAAPASAGSTAISAPAGPPPASYARLYLGVGSKDEVRPGDLVGAIAGEADVAGSQVGRIEIRDSFSIVEVEAAIAEKVIRAVNGTTLKGRSVRVDYDRGRRPEGRPGRSGERRPARRPPRS